MPRILIICGESSGDALASELIIDLKKIYPQIDISGIFGDYCEKEGIKSLVPLRTISVMGISEVLGSIFRIYRAINTVMDDIKRNPPDIIIFIDAFAFTHKIATKVKKQYPDIKLVKYVPPKLWAWAKWRISKLKIYDLILATLPFEKSFFEKNGIKTEFVGHSVLTRIPYIPPKKDELYSNQKQKILLLPGSRRSEIKNLLPIFLKVANIYQEHEFFLPIAPNRSGLIKKIIEEENPEHTVKTISTDKRFEVFHDCDCALAASGTVSLELMMTDTPAIITYKTSALTYLIGKLLIKVKYVSLLNIMFNKKIFPELLQDRCNIENISNALEKLIIKGDNYKLQLKYFEKGRNKISCGENPSFSAANKITRLLKS